MKLGLGLSICTGGSVARDPIAPVVNAITPGTRYSGGNQTVSLTGLGLKNPTGATVDGIAVTVNSSSWRSLTFTTNAITADTYDVVVTNALGSSAPISLVFVDAPACAISDCSPHYAPTSGGTTITLTGTFIPENLACAIGGASFAAGTPAAITYVNATTATIVIPSGLPSQTSNGARTIWVQMYGSAASLEDVLILRAPPIVTSVNVTTRPLAGGGTVTITGSNFTSGAISANTATLDGTPLTITYVNGTTLTFPAPALSAGAKDLIVANLGGTSNTLTGAVTYYAVPTVTSVSTTAKTYAQAVTITVSDSTSMTAGTLGGTALTSFTVVNATTITATLPGKSAGTHALLLTGHPGGTSTSYDVTSVNTNPVYTSVTPTSGPQGGSTALTVAGTGFANGNATSVTIGGNACTSFTVVSDIEITCTSPAGTLGNQTILVVGPAGNSNSGTYEYTNAVFDPTADWSSCSLWLKSSDGVTESGGVVSAWADQSGNARNFTQATAGLRPSYDASDARFNGLPSIEGNGVDQYLSGAALQDFIGATPTAYTLVIVLSLTSASNANGTLGYDEDGIFGELAGYWGLYGNTGPGLSAFSYDANSDLVDKAISYATTYVVAYRYDGTNIYMSVNGGAESSAASGGITVTSQNVSIFRAFSATEHADAAVAEIAMSPNDEASLATSIARLKTKYGIA